MNIAIWSEAFAPSLGGLERFSAELAGWLSRRGHTVTVLTRTPAAGHRATPPSYRVVRRPAPAIALRILRRADAVQIAGASMKGVTLARSVRSKTVTTHAGPQVVCPSGLAWSEHGRCTAGPSPGPCPACDAGGLRGWLDVRGRRRLMSRAGINVFVSRYLRGRCGLRGPVIYNPIPDDIYAQATGGGGDVVVGAGRFVREKGFDVLIRAMALIDAPLVLAGDGPLRSSLQALVVHLCLERKVTFAGRLTHSSLTTLYGRAALTCVPSLWGEPFGYAVAEAMAAGIPVVGTPAGAIPELLGDGRGFVASAMTPESLAATIREALEADAERAARAQKARKFAYEELHVDVIGRRYEELYTA